MSNRARMAEDLTIQQLQQSIQDGVVPSYIGVPLLKSKVEDAKLLQAAKAAQSMGQQPSVAQQIKDYANQQQWSMQQLGNMSNLLRGLPMQSTTTQTYQAAPSGISQVAGLGTTAAAAYGLSGAGKAKGGTIRSGIDHLGMYNATKK